MRPSPARKLGPWLEAGVEGSATQEGDSLAEFQTKTHVQEEPSSQLSVSHTLTAPPYLVAPSPPGGANQRTQGKSRQPRRLQWSRDESVGQDRTGVGVMFPTPRGRDGHSGAEQEYLPIEEEPQPKAAGCPSSQLAQQKRES